MNVNTVVRIERGEAGPEEVAVLATVLLACAAAQPAPAVKDDRSKAGWRPPDHRAPNSWQS
ncbi:acyl-CoA carboxylase epsilon subunit [Streptomyces sp. NPDC050516]|uniref:acyl-CoA carboxylase epsilon subunit n=1 Tax=Streptomyces sp. NPDC050516 TaxID=3365621 RepID=UPI0037A80E02